MAKKKSATAEDAKAAEQAGGGTTEKKKRTPAVKTAEILKLEGELQAAKVSMKELTRLAAGGKLAKWLAGLTATGKARVNEIMNPPDAAPEGERPTDTQYAAGQE